MKNEAGPGTSINIEFTGKFQVEQGTFGSCNDSVTILDSTGEIKILDSRILSLLGYDCAQH